MRFTKSFGLLLVTALAISVAAASGRASAQDKDIVDTAVAAGSFNTLAAALGAADLVDALKGEGPFTVFAPTDAAFAKLPAGTVETLLKPENKARLAAILTYHVVSGAVPSKVAVTLSNAPTLNGQRLELKFSDGKLSIDEATVVQADIECSNGVIHVIDQVVLPNEANIPAVAAEAGTFTTLLAAAKAAGLVDALSGAGPLTVFAPTDAAFAKLPEGTVASLLKPENKSKLADILKYHVVAGRVFSDQALAAKTAKTLQGSSVGIWVKDGVAKVNDSRLIATDIDAANGVIHVIDAVLLPAAANKAAAVDHRGMIEDAIAKGSRLYNHGDHSACAKLYMSTARKMASTPQAPSHMVAILNSALTKCGHTTCPTQQSWTMRRALDSAYYADQQ